MNKSAMAAVALATMMVSPVFSAGYVGAKYKYQTVEFEEILVGHANTFTVDSKDWQVDGSYGFVQDGFGGQIEGSFGSYGESDVLAFAGHAHWPGNGWRLGGLISFLNIDHGTDAVGSHSEVQELSFGLEGSFDFTSDLVGRLHATIGELEGTLDGPGFVSTISNTNDTWYAEAGASYYLSPRTRLDAAIGVGSSSVDDENDDMNFSVGAEYQPLDLPISITARYNRSSSDSPAVGINSDTDTFSVGLRLSFGAETIRDRDRTTPFDGHYGTLQTTRDY